MAEGHPKGILLEFVAIGSCSLAQGKPLHTLDLDQLYQQAYTSNFPQLSRRLQRLLLLFAQQHCIVYNLMEPWNILLICSNGGKDNKALGYAKLVEHDPYAQLCKVPDQIHQIIGDISEASATAAAKGQAQIWQMAKQAV
jgi:hypothetical protein